jgi:hypothetical protein
LRFWNYTIDCYSREKSWEKILRLWTVDTKLKNCFDNFKIRRMQNQHKYMPTQPIPFAGPVLAHSGFIRIQHIDMVLFMHTNLRPNRPASSHFCKQCPKRFRMDRILCLASRLFIITIIVIIIIIIIIIININNKNNYNYNYNYYWINLLYFQWYKKYFKTQWASISCLSDMFIYPFPKSSELSLYLNIYKNMHFFLLIFTTGAARNCLHLRVHKRERGYADICISKRVYAWACMVIETQFIRAMHEQTV